MSKQPPDTSDRAVWVRCNPSWGILLDPDTAEAEFESLETVQFAHQRLGWFAERANADKLISQEEWAALEVGDSPDTWEKLAYGVKFTGDGKYVALSVCVHNEGSSHVEFIREEAMTDGIDWLVEWLMDKGRASRAAAIGVDGKADADDLVKRLMRAGVSKKAVIQLSTGNAISAAGMTLNAIRDGQLTHIKDEELETAVLGASRRQIGKDGFGFGGDFAERLESCGIALWAARTTKRNPNRRAIVRC